MYLFCVCFLGGSVWRTRLLMQETQVRSLGQEDLLQKEMATHSSILTWRIPWAGESGGLHRPWGHERVGHNWTCTHTYIHIHMCVAAILNLHHLFQLLLENTILIFLQNMAHKLIIRFEAQVTVQQFLTGLPVLGFGGFPVYPEPPLATSPAHLWPSSSSHILQTFRNIKKVFSSGKHWMALL